MLACDSSHPWAAHSLRPSPLRAPVSLERVRQLTAVVSSSVASFIQTLCSSWLWAGCYSEEDTSGVCRGRSDPKHHCGSSCLCPEAGSVWNRHFFPGAGLVTYGPPGPGPGMNVVSCPQVGRVEEDLPGSLADRAFGIPALSPAGVRLLSFCLRFYICKVDALFPVSR